MKTFTQIIFMSLFLFIVLTASGYSQGVPPSISPPPACPEIHEAATAGMIQILNNKKTVQQLNKDYGIDITSPLMDRLQPLEKISDRELCSKIIQKFEWLENHDAYSFYRIDELLFSVNLEKTESGELKYVSTSIFNEKLEYLAVIIDI